MTVADIPVHQRRHPGVYPRTLVKQPFHPSYIDAHSYYIFPCSFRLPFPSSSIPADVHVLQISQHPSLNNQT